MIVFGQRPFLVTPSPVSPSPGRGRGMSEKRGFAPLGHPIKGGTQSGEALLFCTDEGELGMFKKGFVGEPPVRPLREGKLGMFKKRSSGSGGIVFG